MSLDDVRPAKITEYMKVVYVITHAIGINHHAFGLPGSDIKNKN